MFGGFSDSGLGSCSFWLQVLGLAGVLGVLVALLGMHLVNGELSARAHRKLGAPSHATAAVATLPKPSHKPGEKPKTTVALAKPTGREITEAQRSAFVSELADAPKHGLQVVTYDRDPEIHSYADQIRVMLVLAGYDCGAEVHVSPAPAVQPSGVLIVVKNPARAPTFSGAIQNAFKSIGIDALGAKDDDFAEDQVVVVVGKKKE